MFSLFIYLYGSVKVERIKATELFKVVKMQLVLVSIKITNMFKRLSCVVVFINLLKQV